MRMRPTAARIVISYAHKDAMDEAHRIGKMLTEASLTFDYDYGVFEGGHRWKEQFRKLVETADHVVFLLSPAALASPACQWEWVYSRGARAQLHPVRVTPDIDTSVLPEWVRVSHQYNLDIKEQRLRFIRALEGEPHVWRYQNMAPAPPDGYVHRPDVFDNAKRALLSSDTVALTAALHGNGGFGKTSLASKLANDPDITEHFYDGILWVTLGEQEVSVVQKLADIVFAVTDHRPGFTTLEAAQVAFDRALDDRRCLLVIDDAWRRADIRPFQARTQRDRTVRLITTRMRAILPQEVYSVVVEQMSGPQATELLARGIPEVQIQAQRERLRNLAEHYLGGWALAIEIAGAILRGWVMEACGELADALTHLEEGLDRWGVSHTLNRDGTASARETIEGTVAVSLAALGNGSDCVRRAEELGAFAEDAAISLISAAKLWGVDVHAATDTARRLHSFSLIRDLNLKSGIKAFWLHDTLRQVLGERLDTNAMRKAHARLVAGWQGADDWPSLRDDYALRHLPMHMWRAGETAALADMLCSPAWMVAKLTGPGLQSLLDDYNSYGPKFGGDVDLVGRTLNLVASALADDPGELPAQLLGRLADEDGAAISALRVAAASLVRPGYPVPIRSTLTPLGLELRRFVGHSKRVTCVAELRDGSIVSGSGDRTIRVWDTATGTELLRLEGHQDEVITLAVLPGGDIISGSADRTLRLWDSTTGRQLQCFEGHTGTVTSVTVLSDGNIVSASSDGTLRLWNTATGEEVRRFEGHIREVTSVAAFLDGRFVSVGHDNTLRIWDWATGQELHRITEGGSLCLRVLALQDGNFVSGDWDGGIDLRDSSSGQVRFPFKGKHRYEVGGLALLPSGRICSTGADGTLRVWDVATGQELYRLEGHGSWVGCVAALTNGRVISAGVDLSIRIWDIGAAPIRYRFEKHDYWPTDLAVFPDGRVASVSLDQTIRVWNIETGRELKKLELKPLETRAIAALSDDLIAYGCFRTITICNVISKEKLRIFDAHETWIHGLTTLPAGRFVSAAEDRTIGLWDAITGKQLQRFSGHGDAVRSVAALPNGQIVSGSADRTLRIWDITTGREVRRLEGHENIVTSVAAAPGDRIVSASFDHTVRIWDTTTGREVGRISGAENRITRVLALPDGRIVSIGNDHVVSVWNIDTGEPIGRLSLDASTWSAAALSGNRLVVGDGLGRLHLVGIA